VPYCATICHFVSQRPEVLAACSFYAWLRYGSFGMQLAVLAGVAALVLTYTELGSAVLAHVGMFFGSDAIDTVWAGMLNASFRIAADHFPLGTGGGTFGSVASYQYGYSQVYYDYGIYLLWGGSPDFYAFLQDVYWPKVIGEGGVLGTFFYLLFLMSCGVYLFYRDPNATFHDEVLRRLCLAFLLLILAISTASAPFTDELLTFVAAISLGYGMSRSLRAGGARNAVRSPAPAR
jgi:cytochrome c biogenesis factor